MSRAPDYVEPVIGWRTWLVREYNGRLCLQSVLFPTIWEPRRELGANCGRWPRRRFLRPWRGVERHSAPDRPCGCGIHAAREISCAAAYLADYDPLQWRVRHRVIGRVSLWGRVVECTHGWRASLAYPECIFVPRRRVTGKRVDAEAIAVALADYGVPIAVVDAHVRDDVVETLAQAAARLPGRRRSAA